jgi:RNA polymerase sigma-70 factor (ECF subfamily)
VTIDTRTDARLVDDVRAGDDGALAALLARHAPTVMRFAMRMCRDEPDAEDVLQETLMTAARGVRELRAGTAVSTWLYAVARSFCIKKRRRGKHAPIATVALDAPESASMASPLASPEAVAGNHELGAALERAIDRLEPSSREVLVLRDVEGLAASEVAEVLGVSIDAVKSRLHRARAAVRADLQPLLAVPRVPSDAACPDVVDLLSRHLEGDVGADACAAMEKHVAGCRACTAACDSLRAAVELCRADGRAPLTPTTAARVRALVEKALAGARD